MYAVYCELEKAMIYSISLLAQQCKDVKQIPEKKPTRKYLISCSAYLKAFDVSRRVKYSYDIVCIILFSVFFHPRTSISVQRGSLLVTVLEQND